MQPSCGACGAALKSGANFCGSCGAAAVAGRHLEATAESALRLSIDVLTLEHFAVGTRCLLRLRVENRAGVASHVEIHPEVHGEQRLEKIDAGVIAPGGHDVVPLWLVPAIGGFQELRGVVRAAYGERVEHYGFDGVLFRVGTGSGPTVSVVNIDQRSARVVDNSRSTFATRNTPTGLVGDAEWHPITLVALTAARAKELVPELEVVAPGPVARATSPRGPVRFTVKTDSASYDVDRVLAQGELATVYAGRRTTDGRDVAVKIADDASDNDLLQAEDRALKLLHENESPQRKHLPVMLDRCETKDGRIGAVFERLDGIDLVEIRRRLPRGVEARHMIWLMRRCLSVLGLAHSRGVLHGNVDPAHIVVRAGDHNVWLVDWCYAIVNPAKTGESFRVLNEEYSPPEVSAKLPPLPASDLYSLGKCMIFAAGGDPKSKALPDSMDERMQRFIKFMVVESERGRAQDAWELYARLDKLRAEIYGSHEFVEFVV